VTSKFFERRAMLKIWGTNKENEKNLKREKITITTIIIEAM
jgi:hypothetical protein